jgi:hypothetical protein
MNEKIFEIIPNLDILMEEKDFNKLTTSEQNIILEYITIEEYESYRATILESKILFSEESSGMVIDPILKENLLKRFELRQESGKFNISKIIINLINYHLPVYKFGLAASIAILFLFFFRPVFFGNTNFIARTDTIFVDKIIKQYVAVQDSQATHEILQKSIISKKNILENSVNQPNISETENISSMREVRQDENLIQTAINNIDLSKKMKRGHPITEDSILLKYLVTVY